MPPPPPPFRNELDGLDELAVLEHLEREAAGCPPEDDGEPGDVFGLMECDLGSDAKRPCRRLETATVQQDAGPPEHGPRETPAVPPTKKRRLVGKQAPCG